MTIVEGHSQQQMCVSCLLYTDVGRRNNLARLTNNTISCELRNLRAVNQRG